MIIARCEDIRKTFSNRTGVFARSQDRTAAVDGVTLAIEKGSVMGLVGESGSGKTTLGKIFLGILKQDSGRVDLRVSRVQVIFQDPFGSLNPKMSVYDIVSEGLVVKGDRKDLSSRVYKALDLVRLPGAAAKRYPHQFSGGERQRIAIARAIITEPEFMVCDEPVSNLDVTIQLQVLELLRGLKDRLSITYLFISHDLRVVRHISDRVAVMRHGKIVEEGPISKVYDSPQEPYTKELLSSVLSIRPWDK